jgi:transcriptional regulator with XRE-family HTH domain
MTHAKLLTILASRALKAGSQARLAAELGISTGYLNDVMTGRKEPGKGILEPLGLERVVSYRRVKSSQQS